jgi:hypothetical protein
MEAASIECPNVNIVRDTYYDTEVKSDLDNELLFTRAHFIQDAWIRALGGSDNGS